jgi:streptogramin lyase
MRSLRNLLICSVAACIATLSPSIGATGSRTQPHHSHAPYLLVGGLGSGSGSTIGPDGDLYVAEPASGTIVRVDPRTGETSTFARDYRLGSRVYPLAASWTSASSVTRLTPW